MKSHYTLLACAVVAICGLFVVLNPVSAESNSAFVAQPQINMLVTMAVPPYKW